MEYNPHQDLIDESQTRRIELLEHKVSFLLKQSNADEAEIDRRFHEGQRLEKQAQRTKRRADFIAALPMATIGTFVGAILAGAMSASAAWHLANQFDKHFYSALCGLVGAGLGGILVVVWHLSFEALRDRSNSAPKSGKEPVTFLTLQWQRPFRPRALELKNIVHSNALPLRLTTKWR
jgi:hypothetical protein